MAEVFPLVINIKSSSGLCTLLWKGRQNHQSPYTRSYLYGQQPTRIGRFRQHSENIVGQSTNGRCKLYYIFSTQKGAEVQLLTLANICWFTDDSKAEQKSVVTVHLASRVRKYYRLRQQITTFQTEIHAIKMCAGVILVKNFIHKSTNTFCVSQPVLKALETHKCTSKLNL